MDDLEKKLTLTVQGTDTKTPGVDSSYVDKLDAVSIMNLKEYEFLSMAYHGDSYFRTGRLIVPHPREGTYKDRRELSFYKNFVKPIVNSRVDPVYSANVVREVTDESGKKTEPPLFTKFLEDCDNCGTSLSAWMEVAARESNLMSLSFLVMDNFSSRSKSVKDNVNNRILPYLYMQTRDTVEDYGVNKFGAIEWIRFYDHTAKGDNGKKVEYYRYWDSVKSVLQKEVGEDRFEDVEIVEHNLGIVPVYPFMFVTKRKKESYELDYEFYDLARCNWTIYNLDSSTMEAIRDQCFSLLCIQGSKQGDVVVGTKAICWVDQDVSNMPQFISPNPEVAKLASEYADKIKRELFEIAEQNGVTAKRSEGVDVASGKAKEWDFQAHGFILQKIAGICRRAELWVADTFKRYTGESFIYVPQYKMDYGVKESEGLITVQEKVLDNNLGVKAVTLAKKNIAKIAFAHNDPMEVEEVLKDIEDSAENEIVSTTQIEDEPASQEENNETNQAE